MERRRCCLILSVAALLIVGVVVVLAVTLSKPFKTTFISRCEGFKGYDCQKIWGAFERAYVGQDPCNVPMEAYDPFIAEVPFTHQCNRMMFWSKTKDVVHDFTEKRNCLYTLQDTLLGSVLNELTWCGKEGSSETFTTGCPGWTDCDNNAVRSFWNRASAAFTDFACGDVTVMLDGSIATPFSPSSTLARIEIGKLQPSKVTSLNVILVTGKVSTCASENLQELNRTLPGGIRFTCNEVTQSRIDACSSSSHEDCRACLVDPNLNKISDDAVKPARLICLELALISLQMLLIH